MGLDTYLHRRNDGRNDIAYWRKCYGIDNWLSSKAKTVLDEGCRWEFDTAVLDPVIKVMSKYINKLIERANKLGYFIENESDLQDLTAELTTDQRDYIKLEKIIRSFNFDDLTFDSFDDSIWDALHVFVMTYKNFTNAIRYDDLILVSSY